MKRFALFAACLLPLVSLSAQEVIFRAGEWDSIAPILDVTECYITAKDSRAIRSARLNLEVYHKGGKKEWLSGGGISFSDSPKPLDLKATVLFRHEEGKPGRGYLSVMWEDAKTASRFNFDQTDLPFAKGVVSGRFRSSLDATGKMPVFYILINPLATGGYRFVNTPEKLVEANPDCAVVIGTLVLDGISEAR